MRKLLEELKKQKALREDLETEKKTLMGQVSALQSELIDLRTRAQSATHLAYREAGNDAGQTSSSELQEASTRLSSLQRRIDELEQENEELRSHLDTSKTPQSTDAGGAATRLVRERESLLADLESLRAKANVQVQLLSPVVICQRLCAGTLQLSELQEQCSKLTAEKARLAAELEEERKTEIPQVFSQWRRIQRPELVFSFRN